MAGVQRGHVPPLARAPRRRRPSLLLDPEWPGVPAAAARLQACYPDPADVARLVAAEPLLLAEDLDRVLAELERCGRLLWRRVPCWRACGRCVHRMCAARSKQRRPADPRLPALTARCRVPLRLAAGGAGVRARDALLADPGLASQAARLSHLSLW